MGEITESAELISSVRLFCSLRTLADEAQFGATQKCNSENTYTLTYLSNELIFFYVHYNSRLSKNNSLVMRTCLDSLD